MEEQKTKPIWIALAWLVALMPLTWGLYNTMVKAMPLFSY